jgi:hypothetical protein
MKRTILVICVTLLFPVMLLAQSLPLTMRPDGGNKRASVSETVGITDISIHYDRPGVKGRDGKIWGQLVPVGYADQGFGTSKAAPWRAGSNENTTFGCSTDVTINGQPLPAGKYGFFVAYGTDECTLIFSKNASSWGSFYYKPEEDVLRVKVKPQAIDHKVEWLKYEFLDETDSTATVGLQWERLLIPFTVGVDYVQTQLAQIRKELRSERGFAWEAWNQAAAWCALHHTNLQEASLWADSATGINFGGAGIFTPWATRADVLTQLGRTDEADSIMKRALPLGSMNELHVYGRQLLAQKRVKAATDVFTLNYKKNPGQFTTLMGMARASSANGDYKTALKYATQAQPLAPDPINKNGVEAAITKLKNGQDIN